MQVVPVHIFDKSARRFNLNDAKLCPPVQPIDDANHKMPIFTDALANFNATWGEKFKKALNLTGDKDYFDYYMVYNICDSFVSGYTEGKELKMLTDAGIDLAEFNKTATDFLFLDIFTPFHDKEAEVAKASMSPTGLDLVDWMTTRINYDAKNQGYFGYGSNKMVMYSAHDTSMAAIQAYLQSVFNTTDIYYTPFASSIFFELHRPDNKNYTSITQDDYYVTIIYNDNYLLNMTFVDFKSNIQSKSYNTSQISSFCGFDPVTNTDPYIISTIVLGVFSFCLLAYVLYVCYRKKRHPLRNSSIRCI
jgi:hypothetical protein